MEERLLERVFVTGGAGFIGSHVVRALLEGGTAVTVLDDLSTGRLENLEGFERDLRFVEGDIRDSRAVRDAVSGASRVIHLAAEISVPKSVERPGLTYDVNVAGTVSVFEEARRAGVRCCVVASSAAVYGETDEEPRSEDSPALPLSPYGISKLACERLGGLYTDLGLPVVSVRLFNVYGPRQRHDSPYAAAVPIFLNRLAEGRPPTVFGDGLQRRDFVYVGDVARAFVEAAARPDLGGEVFNVASGRAVDLLELIRAMNGVLGTDLDPEFAEDRPGDIRFSAADVTRARERLGFQAQVSLREGLHRTAEHIRGTVVR